MPTLDDIGRAAARDALADASSVDAEAGLARIRTAGRVPAHAPRNRPWAALGTAAAVLVVAVVAGVAVWQRDPAERLVPGTAPTTAPGATVATSTTSPPATTTSTVLPATTVAPAPPAPSGLAVNYLTPPPLLQPTPFATIPVPASGSGMLAVTMAGGAVFVDRDASQAIVVAPDGSSRTVPLDAAPFAPVIGPDDVLYGIDSDDTTQPPTFTTIAVPLAGSRAGEVVASAPVDGNPYLELPAGALGLGPSGIVDRVRQVGTQLLGYVDAEGRPLDLDAPPAPLVTVDDTDTVRSSTGATWALDIVRHPEHPRPYTGESPPAPTADGGAVYWTSIGGPTPETAGSDYPDATLPVVAVLAPDGSAQWSRVPDGWGVAASDVGGTILASVDGDQLQLARLQASPDEPVATTTTTVSTPAPDSPLASLAQQIGASELIARTLGLVTVHRDGSTTEVTTPPDLYVWTDGEYLWTDDGNRSTAMTLDGTVVCAVEGSLHRIRQDPDGGYVASVERTEGVTFAGEEVEIPNTAVDCETGEAQPIEPISWRREGGGRFVQRVAQRSFTGEYDAEGNADIANESGVSINGEDYAGYHTFDETASRVAYLDIGPSPGSPHTSQIVRARDTTTGELLWTTELDAVANGLTWYGERVLVHIPREDDVVTPSAVIVLDAATGDVLTTVPTDLDIAYVG